MNADEFVLTMNRYEWQLIAKLSAEQVVSLDQSEIDRAFKNIGAPVWARKTIKKLLDRGFTFELLQDFFPPISLFEVETFKGTCKRFIRMDEVTGREVLRASGWKVSSDPKYLVKGDDTVYFNGIMRVWLFI